jgi:hypothetical protein
LISRMTISLHIFDALNRIRFSPNDPNFSLFWM